MPHIYVQRYARNMMRSVLSVALSTKTVSFSPRTGQKLTSIRSLKENVKWKRFSEKLEGIFSSLTAEPSGPSCASLPLEDGCSCGIFFDCQSNVCHNFFCVSLSTDTSTCTYIITHRRII